VVVQIEDARWVPVEWCSPVRVPVFVVVVAVPIVPCAGRHVELAEGGEDV